MSTNFVVRSNDIEHFGNALADTFMRGDGPPQNGVTGINAAPLGADYTDQLTGLRYENTGDADFPTWALVSDTNVLTDSSALVFILAELRVISRLLAVATRSSDSPEILREDEINQLASDNALVAN